MATERINQLSIKQFPHESLYGNTPAEIAGIDLNLENHKWENLLMQSLKFNRGEIDK